MSDASDGSSEKHDPLAALRQPSFQLYTASRVLSIFGMTMLQAVLAWQVYQLSGSALSLGLLGLVRFLPSLGLSLIGGAVADTYNRRNIVLASQCVPLISVSVLAIATLGGWVTLPMIYGMVLLWGLASAFEGPARQALLPAIVRPETFANAVTISSTLQSLGMVSGPAAGGLMLAVIGIGASYWVYVGIVLVAVTLLALLKYNPVVTEKRGISITLIKEGITYVRGHQEVLGSMSLDMFAVIFGGATALLPIYAHDILHVGTLGYGILTSALDGGALLMNCILIFRPPIRRAGRALILAVIFYGAFTIGFGLSREFVVSVLFYMLLGSADAVSVVMRSTIIQLTTPDALRGRVSAVNQVFIGASNQVGAMESGFLAAVTSATFSVVFGGATAIAVASTIAWRMPNLFNYVIPRGGDRVEKEIEESTPVRDEVSPVIDDPAAAVLEAEAEAEAKAKASADTPAAGG